MKTYRLLIDDFSNIYLLDADGKVISKDDWETLGSKFKHTLIIEKMVDGLIASDSIATKEHDDIPALFKNTTAITVPDSNIAVDLSWFTKGNKLKQLNIVKGCLIYNQNKLNNVEICCPYHMRDIFDGRKNIVKLHDAKESELAWERRVLKANALGSAVLKYKLPTSYENVKNLVNIMGKEVWDSLVRDAILNTQTRIGVLCYNYGYCMIVACGRLNGSGNNITLVGNFAFHYSKNSLYVAILDYEHYLKNLNVGAGSNIWEVRDSADDWMINKIKLYDKLITPNIPHEYRSKNIFVSDLSTDTEYIVGVTVKDNDSIVWKKEYMILNK